MGGALGIHLRRFMLHLVRLPRPRGVQLSSRLSRTGSVRGLSAVAPEFCSLVDRVPGSSGVLATPRDATSRSPLVGRALGPTALRAQPFASGTDSIVGATIVAERAGDMLAELTLAAQSGSGFPSSSCPDHLLANTCCLGGVRSWARFDVKRWCQEGSSKDGLLGRPAMGIRSEILRSRRGRLQYQLG